MTNHFVYTQLQTQNREKAQSFYGRLFGWAFDERATPAGPYVEVQVGDERIGGIVGHRDEKASSMWVPYVRVADIKATAEKARQLGANVLQPPVQLPDKSWFSLIVDPTGATFGLHQVSVG